MLELVQYEKKYAKGVADMWNKSADSWGGKISVDTEETIIKKEEASTFLELTLAKEKEDIIGYCKLSVDHHDEGALYIDLLNVRPDYHCKSIGKKLLLDSIDKTIDRGWRRLDLFTWPGNTKAIPLYKKCGFFWEKRERTTHLINLIPDVLSQDLVSDFFEFADWYKDSTREIVVEQDSRIVNGFDLWNYTWEKDGRYLEMEYSRRGRGLRKIDNNDFTIEVIVEDMKLVFGDSYQVKYLFKNKTDSPLEISIEGLDDKNIKFNFKNSFVLDKEKEVNASFFVGEIDKKQKEKHTHPVVKSNISVNGKKATFMTGIEPVFPLTLSFKTEKPLQLMDVEIPVYIDIENETGQDTRFEFSLENTSAYTLSKNDYVFDLKKDEKISVKTNIILHESTLVTDKIKIKAIRPGKDAFEFMGSLDILLQGNYGKFYGEREEYYTIGNGSYLLSLNKDNNVLEYKDVSCDLSSNLFAPKLGKPFSQEFEKKQPEVVSYEMKNDWVQMTASYISDDFPGVGFNRFFRLHANGILKRWFEFENLDDIKKRITFSDGMYLMPKSAVVSYDGQIISLEQETSDYIGYLESHRVDENWIFIQDKDYNCGYIWPKSYEMNILGYYPSIEHELTLQSKGDVYVTEPIITAKNAYKSWHDIREFALGKRLEEKPLIMASHIDVNGGNPFTNNKVDVVYKEYKKMSDKGRLTVGSKSVSVNETLTVDVDKNKMLLDLSHEVAADIMSHSRLIYKLGKNEVEKNLYKKSDLDVYQIDNGLVSFECAPEFAPNIFSLKYDQTEWLSSSFPKATSYKWWKSYIGGGNTRPDEVSLQTIEEEEKSCQFVVRKDNFGNEWTGLEITTEIKAHKDQKGMMWKQYYLTLPGLPLITYFVEYFNKQETYKYNMELYNELFFNLPEKAGDAYVEFVDDKGRLQRVLSGNHDRDILYPGTFEFHLKSSESFITLYKHAKDCKYGFYIGPGYIGGWGMDFISTEVNASTSILPKFLFFGKTSLKDAWLKDFNNIRF